MLFHSRHCFFRVLAAGFVLALALAGCAPRQPTAGAVSYHAGSLDWAPVDPRDTVVSFAMSDAPGIVSVREYNASNMLYVQEIILENDTVTPGENVLRVVFKFDAPLGWTMLNDTQLRRAAAELRRNSANPDAKELEAAFNAAPYEIVEGFPTNHYGIYGYAATSRGTEPQCVVAWQRVKDQKRILPREMEAMHLHLRLCSAEADTARLLTVFENLILQPRTGVMPLDWPAAAPASTSTPEG